MNPLKAKKSLFDGMLGEAEGRVKAMLKEKYTPKPPPPEMEEEAEPMVETEAEAGAENEGMPQEELMGLLEKLSPEDLKKLLSSVED